ncbi:peroxide stress protein YaaA [soil metagenome]
MLILLPPSETKRDGGADDAALDLAALSFPSLTKPRRTVLAAFRRLSRNLATMSSALKLGPNQRFELQRNRQIATSPTMPALERYTGVLFDALDAGTLSAEARAFAGGRVAIHSALFGLLDADDPIPAYRLSHDSRLHDSAPPTVRLKAEWAAPITEVLGNYEGLILDFRSEGYVGLGPVPATANSFFLRVVSEGPDGQRRALNHFNKSGKGMLTRRLLEGGVDHASVESLVEWAAANGIRLTRRGDREIELVVD